MTNSSIFLSCLFAAMLLAAGVGCHRSAETHDDHLEHHTPEHKPASLASAIEQIELRSAALESDAADAKSDRKQQLTELLEIARWMPEIAGDSDLPETEWNVVDRVSVQLCDLFQKQLGLLQQGQAIDLKPHRDSIRAATEELRKVAATMPAEAVSPFQQSSQDPS